MAPDLSRARSLLTQADTAATEGRELIDASIRYHREALALVPDDTVLEYALGRLPEWSGQVWRAKGEWRGSPDMFRDGLPGDEWIEEQWMRGNLHLPEATA